MKATSTHTARKRFGQNFLHDENVIMKIVDAVNDKPGQVLVEIGPGQGALTHHLLDVCQSLHVIEIDRDLAAAIAQQYGSRPRFHLHTTDALRVDYCALEPQRRIRLIGNLPYNISTPLIFHVLKNTDCIDEMLFMLQKEVVDRMAASPGTRDYGRLSVMVQYHCEVEALFDVGPECFHPRPKVNSAVVRLTPIGHRTPLADNPQVFAQLVNQAFSQRRKTLRNALKKWLDSEQIAACGIDPGQRPETVSVEDYICLANRCGPDVRGE